MCCKRAKHNSYHLEKSSQPFSNTFIIQCQLLEAFLGLWQRGQHVLRTEGHEGGGRGRREEPAGGGGQEVELGGVIQTNIK